MAEKDTRKRFGTCVENDEFRRNASGPLQFVQENRGKLASLLQGERDSCPSDLGLQTFYQFVASSRGQQLVEMGPL